MDFLKIAMAELANISERRIERLVNPQLNDLPPFLSPEPGLQSGAMIMQYAAASCSFRLYREDSFLYIGLWDLKSFYNFGYPTQLCLWTRKEGN